MKRYYNAIMQAMEKGASHFEQLNVPEPKTFDLHLGQETDPEDFEFEAPAIFYNYSIDYASEYVYIYLYIVQEWDPDTENFAPKDDSSPKFFDFLTAVKRCLMSVKPQGGAYGKITLNQEQPQPNDNFHCHLLTYRATYHADMDTDLTPTSQQIETSLTLQRGRLKQTTTN